MTGGRLAHCCIHVTYLYAALERVCKRHIEKRDPDTGTVITMTLSGLQASLSLTTILRWTSSLTATPGPGYGATPPPRTPPPLRILLQNHLLLCIPKDYCLLPRTFLTTLITLEAGADVLEGAKDLAIADLMNSCCGAKDKSSALFLVFGLS